MHKNKFMDQIINNIKLTQFFFFFFFENVINTKLDMDVPLYFQNM